MKGKSLILKFNYFGAMHLKVVRYSIFSTNIMVLRTNKKCFEIAAEPQNICRKEKPVIIFLQILWCYAPVKNV